MLHRRFNTQRLGPDTTIRRYRPRRLWLRLHTALLPALLVVLAAGCGVSRLRYFPTIPMRTDTISDGRIVRTYDTDGDGQEDFSEELGNDGRVQTLRYHHGATVEAVGWPPEDGGRHHLLVVLDSVPFEVVHELWVQGRFRLFRPPSRIISPFPVMTDVSLTEFFGMAPVPGVEAQFLDGDHLTNGTASYLSKRNMPWLSRVDYGLEPIGHAFAYTNPEPWFEYELHQIQQRALEAFERNEDFVGYVVGTSALGSKEGRNGHLQALVRVDRMCQALEEQMHGTVQITLMSDHGHNLQRSHWFSLARELRALGYRVGQRLGPRVDVVVPEWGMVSCAAIHTHHPGPVAEDVVSLEGVELSTYLDAERDVIVVLSRAGRAEISLSGERYTYRAQRGDPLRLLPVLRRIGALDPDGRGGSASDQDWLAATLDARYPDAPHRLWRAFHGLIKNTPDVLVALQDGYHAGSESMKRRLEMAATHGNLRGPSTFGFVMTTDGVLPDSIRMEDLAAILRHNGVPVPASQRRIRE